MENKPVLGRRIVVFVVVGVFLVLGVLSYVYLIREQVEEYTLDIKGFDSYVDIVDNVIARVNLTSFKEVNKWKSTFRFSPIVDEEHKIVLCTIPKASCTAWRVLLRRLRGLEDWETMNGRIVHQYGGKTSGLTYLSDYSEEEAERIMNDPTYFKGSIVRNPITRILSAWKDKFEPGRVDRWGDISWPNFAMDTDGTCNNNEHWAPQSCFCGMRRWKYDMIVHMEDGMPDLLEEMVKRGHLDKEFAYSGWGKSGDEAFLDVNRVGHKTDTSSTFTEYYGFHVQPGVFSHVLQAMAEDIVRFDYKDDIKEMEPSVQED
eukprot:m.34291 g.34291  ORF g.34291 m.34291 type:complete len:316 (+) comp6517_c0_seq1:54-1001(+)